MRIVVPTTNVDCPPVHAMSREGLFFDTVIIEDDYHYSRLFAELWQTVDDFVIIEHDVVPWPGAIYQLFDCQRVWCSHMYPAAPHNLTNALGCIKIGATIIQNYPDLPSKWHDTKWNQLDGVIFRALLGTGHDTHIHEPPFAHVKK